MDEGRMSFCDFDLGPRMRQEERARYERAKAWLDQACRVLADVAAVDPGSVRLLLTPQGPVRVGCSRLELAAHSLREQGVLPWPDGSFTGGKAPWDRSPL